jgi:hypothetical protein
VKLELSQDVSQEHPQNSPAGRRIWGMAIENMRQLVRVSPGCQHFDHTQLKEDDKTLPWSAQNS